MYAYLCPLVCYLLVCRVIFSLSLHFYCRTAVAGAATDDVVVAVADTDTVVAAAADAVVIIIIIVVSYAFIVATFTVVLVAVGAAHAVVFIIAVATFTVVVVVAAADTVAIGYCCLPPPHTATSFAALKWIHFHLFANMLIPHLLAEH